jgi:ABC-type transport system involved in multi-copper enzyme maturation permease subunit
MKKIWIVALNTYREIIRDRILYGLVVFALLIIGLSLILGQLSFTEQTRLSIDLGMAAIQFSSVILSMFVGSSLVGKEIDKRTVMTLLARPISRQQFLIAKFLGMALVLLTVMTALSLILGFVFYTLNVPIKFVYLMSLSGIMFESLVLLSFVIFFGTFLKPMMTVSITLCVFVVGHWVYDLAFFKDKSDSEAFKFISSVIIYAFPNLERFNWRSAVTYDEVIEFSTWGLSLVYACAWVLILLGVSSFIFRRRDLA